MTTSAELLQPAKTPDWLVRRAMPPSQPPVVPAAQPAPVGPAPRPVPVGPTKSVLVVSPRSAEVALLELLMTLLDTVEFRTFCKTTVRARCAQRPRRVRCVTTNHVPTVRSFTSPNHLEPFLIEWPRLAPDPCNLSEVFSDPDSVSYDMSIHVAMAPCSKWTTGNSTPVVLISQSASDSSDAGRYWIVELPQPNELVLPDRGNPKMESRRGCYLPQKRHPRIRQTAKRSRRHVDSRSEVFQPRA